MENPAPQPPSEQGEQGEGPSKKALKKAEAARLKAEQKAKKAAEQAEKVCGCAVSFIFHSLFLAGS
jgi:hypothetical protein